MPALWRSSGDGFGDEAFQMIGKRRFSGLVDFITVQILFSSEVLKGMSSHVTGSTRWLAVTATDVTHDCIFQTSVR